MSRHVVIDTYSWKSFEPNHEAGPVQVQVETGDDEVALLSTSFPWSQRPVVSISVQQHQEILRDDSDTLGPQSQMVIDCFLKPMENNREARRSISVPRTNTSPLLSVTRSRDFGRGHVIWQEGPQTLNILRLDGTGPPTVHNACHCHGQVEIESRGWTTNNGQYIPSGFPRHRGRWNHSSDSNQL